MPARLVYSPSAYVYTKNSQGTVFDLSGYVTSGEVQRLINQASTAEVTLRNPERIFTVNPNSSVPLFHPMDAITIFLERIKGYPVQVFTGYLDDTPYYQMFPGTITLQATCTLKRLIYTYFDPSLPYVNSFFAYYGWVSDQQGQIINMKALANAEPPGNVTDAGSGANSSNDLVSKPMKGNIVSMARQAKTSGQSANGGNTTPAQTSAGTTLDDGSIGQLLFATLQDIGQWDPSNIYIENLPSGSDGLGARIATLMATLLSEESSAASELTTFMDAVIGSGSSGSGGGTGNPNNGSVPGGGGNAPSGSFTKKTWPAAFLSMLGIVQTDTNMQMLYGWETAEGGNWNNTAKYNPINTTQGAPGATTVNSAGVKAYTSWQQGLNATKQTIEQNAYGYPAILAALKGSDFSAFVAAVTSSQWGTTDLTVSDCTDAPGGMGSIAVPGVSTTTAKSRKKAKTTTRRGGSVIVSNDMTLSKRSSVNIGGQTNAGSNTTTVDKGGGNAQTRDQMTCYAAIVEACNAIAKQNLPYVFAGGHTNIGVPSGGPPPGYDCSGAVSAVLGAAQLMTTPVASGGIQGALGSSVASGLDNSNNAVNVFANADHTFLQVGGRYWSSSHPGDGPGWKPNFGSSYISGFTQFHIKQSVLSQSVQYSLGVQGGNTVPSASGGSSGGSGGSPGGVNSTSGAEAFTAELEFPSIQDMSMAILLGSAGNGLMHDQQLLPFIQQLTQASMRSFQSLPNGDFFAFYPDYFGEFDQHPAYWEIDDIEILSGDIYLNDQSLVTHQYVVGDNTYPADAGMYNALFSTGVITVYNAFQPGLGILSTAADAIASASSSGSTNDHSTPQKLTTADASVTQFSTKTKAKQNKSAPSTPTSTSDPNNSINVMDQKEAIEFVKRYGARPQVSNYPQVRSSLFEMYLAYQQFMLSWANQFRTTFSFTFMPEVYPGGKISFPTHGLQMYVSSVTHSFDYEEGFTTEAVLTAPSQLPNSTAADVPPDMIQALVKPIRAAALTDDKPSASKPSGAGSSGAAHHIAQGAASTLSNIGSGISGLL